MKQQSRQSRAAKLALKNYTRTLYQSKVMLLAILLPGIGDILVNYAPSIIVARIIERFGDSSFTLQDIMPYVIWMGIIWLIGEALWRIAMLMLEDIQSKTVNKLQIEAFEEVLRKDPAFFANNFAGSLTKKIVGYGKNFITFQDTVIFNITTGVFSVIFAVAILWYRSPIIALSLLVFVVGILAVVRPHIKRRKHLTDVREIASNKMAGHVADAMGNISSIHAFATESEELKQHIKLSTDHTQKMKAAWRFNTVKLDMKLSPLFTLINVLGLALAIHLGSGAQQISTIFLTFSFYTQATRLVWEFNRIYRNLESSISEAAQFTELLLDDPQINDPAQAVPFAAHSGRIELKSVDFAYSDDKSTPHLFKNLSLTIEPGQKVALVGPSGGGKSTITKLLLRFIDIDSGDVLIDDQPIAKMTKSDLRKSISYVPQESNLFHRSIMDNIAYGKPNADTKDVLDAARKAHADEFITKLPNQYKTLVGERGTKLSGGQRQRISIARAMLKNAPILVLDEATSALDSESESLIQDALWKLMEDKTSIVIAHRLSTIQKMDRILVLDDGRIIEDGTHESLSKKKGGMYAKLWAHQSGGFIED